MGEENGFVQQRVKSLMTSKSRTDKWKCSFQHLLIHLWNSLPRGIWKSLGLAEFTCSAAVFKCCAWHFCWAGHLNYRNGINCHSVLNLQRTQNADWRQISDSWGLQGDFSGDVSLWEPRSCVAVVSPIWFRSFFPLF